VRLLWNRRAAWLAAALLAASHLSIHFSRNAMNNIYDALFLPLVFGCVWLGWKTGRRRAWLMAGLALGLSQYFYIGSRVLLIQLGVLGVFWLITERRRVKTQLLNIGLAAGVFATSVMPIVYWAVLHPNEYLTRFSATNIFSNGWFELAMQTQRVGPIEILWNQLLDTVRVFVAGPDGLFYVGQALWSPLMSIVAVLSLVYLLHRWREDRSFFVLSSLGLILLIGGVFIMSPMVGAQHFVGTTPLIALSVGVLIDQGISRGNQRWPKPRVWATVGTAMVAGLMLADADYYFGHYIQAGTINTGDMEWAMKIGEYLHDIESDAAAENYQIVCVSTEFSCDHSTVHFLAPRLGEHTQTVPGPISSLAIEQSRNSRLILIIAGYLPDDIQAAEKRYPGAQRLDHVGLHNDLLFVSFEVAAEPSS
jgi:4-amino-4-deoxy-L-arabinose transferase-like glycosyltransferase